MLTRVIDLLSLDRIIEALFERPFIVWPLDGI
jgi:hypothetical protein